MVQEYEYARIQYGTAELIEGESDLPPGVIYMQCGEGDNSSSNTTATSSIPAGIITMWSGSITSIPNSWALCDGNNGTPDLTNRFIVGAGGDYTVGNTGGSEEVTLTIEQIPSHSHAINHTPGNTSGTSGSRLGSNFDDYTIASQSTGGDQPHENRPPYYALAYIMKL